MPFNLLQKLKLVKAENGIAFQILSDLHLEVGNQYQSFDIPPAAPYLILAGDTGRLADYAQYLAFLQRQTARFELVFLVLGNHEFYGTTISDGLALAQRLAEEPSLQGKLILLNRARYDVPGTPVTLLGCTLWSHVPAEAADVVRAKVSDFRRIAGWDVSLQNAAHAADVVWLRAQVAALNAPSSSAAAGTGASGAAPAALARKILIVTHHAPLKRGTSSPRNEGNAWSSAFASDVLVVQGQRELWDGVSAWVFGHTHFCTDFVDRETRVRVVANQRGYVLPGAGAAQRVDGEDVKEVRFDVKKVVRI